MNKANRDNGDRGSQSLLKAVSGIDKSRCFTLAPNDKPGRSSLGARDD
jgi:hypothetical protein